MPASGSGTVHAANNSVAVKVAAGALVELACTSNLLVSYPKSLAQRKLASHYVTLICPAGLLDGKAAQNAYLPVHYI